MQKIKPIYLKEILQSDIFMNSSSALTIALGKDAAGNPFVSDLKKLPHLLIAGNSKNSKNILVNTILLSLLYKNSPDMLKLVMIDPKMMGLSIYDGIPHLVAPIITKAKQAIKALENMINEMERRYEILSQSKTKNIDDYNKKAKEKGLPHVPYIVVVINELADLMMTDGRDVEFYISRLAQMARASGIHLIVATKQPSADVITGLIKANLPSRISCKVDKKADSDMLFSPAYSSELIKFHLPHVSTREIKRVVRHLKKQRTADKKV